MTIIARVQKALEASGNKPLADELVGFIHKLVGNVNDYMGLHDKLRKTTALYINTIQHRCTHRVWILDHSNKEGDPGTWGPEDSISCIGCGHTLCDPATATWAKKVIQDGRWMYSVGGRKFTLSTDIRKRLGDRLIVKEMKDELSGGHPPTEDKAEVTGATTMDHGAGRGNVLPVAQPDVGQAGDRQGDEQHAGELPPRS